MASKPENPDDEDSVSPRRDVLRRVILFAIVGVVFVAFLVAFRDQLTIESLASRETQWREFQQTRPWTVVAVTFCIYVLVTSLSIPGATPLTLSIAWLLGFWQALILVSFASTTGATLAFLLSRYLLADWVQRRFARRWESFDAMWQRDGAFYLFSLRLIAAVPFFLINLLMGLTSIRTRTFWWVSQLGMLPGTCLYVWFGASLPSLRKIADDGINSLIDWKMLAALAALGTFPLLTKKILQKVRQPA